MAKKRLKVIFICTANNLSLPSLALLTQEVGLSPRYFQLFFLQLHRFKVERMNDPSKGLCFSLWPDTQLWPTIVTKFIYKINFVEKVQWLVISEKFLVSQAGKANNVLAGLGRKRSVETVALLSAILKHWLHTEQSRVLFTLAKLPLALWSQPCYWG